MPRGSLTKEEMKRILLMYKYQLDQDTTWVSDPKGLAHLYLNKVLGKIEEYAR
jgi:hypothetical protein